MIALSLIKIDRHAGVQLDMAFNDTEGRTIELHIKEEERDEPSSFWNFIFPRRARKPFALLAPFGSATRKPPSLPLVLLYDFYFVRKKDTTVTISVDGQTHKPDDLPIRLDGCPVYFLRYSSDPFCMMMNECTPMIVACEGGVVEGTKTETH